MFSSSQDHALRASGKGLVRPPLFAWTDEHQAEMAALAAAGKSAGLVARKFGISRSAILGRANRTGVLFTGIERVTIELRPIDAGRAVEAYARLHDISKVCAELGYPYERTRQALLDSGITLRTGPRPGRKVAMRSLRNAAPDLLAALKMLRSVARGPHANDGSYRILIGSIDLEIVDASIAKAEGRQ